MRYFIMSYSGEAVLNAFFEYLPIDVKVVSHSAENKTVLLEFPCYDAIEVIDGFKDWAKKNDLVKRDGFSNTETCRLSYSGMNGLLRIR